MERVGPPLGNLGDKGEPLQEEELPQRKTRPIELVVTEHI